MARIECWFKQDLKKPIKVRSLGSNAFTLDNAGSLIGVEVFSNGQTVALTGSVTGYCILQDGTTVSVVGTRSENKAYILLPQSALAYDGIIKITIKLTDSSVITTLLAVVATVCKSRTDAIITPSQQIITDWSQQISAEMQAVEDASAAQDAKIDDLKSEIDGYNYLKSRNINVPTSNILAGYYSNSLVFTESPAKKWLTYIINVSPDDHFVAYLDTVYATTPKIIEFDSQGTPIRAIKTSAAAQVVEYIVPKSGVSKVGFAHYANAMQDNNSGLYIKKLDIEEKSVIYKRQSITPTVVENSFFNVATRAFSTKNGTNYYQVSCLPGEKYYIYRAITAVSEVAAGIVVFFKDDIPLTKIAGTVSTYFTGEVTVPTGANKMIVQTTPGYGTTISLQVYSFNEDENIEAIYNKLQANTDNINKKARFYYDSTVGYCYRYKYTDSLDCVFRFKLRGTNQNFGMTNIAHITNTGKHPKSVFNDFTQANNFYSLSSEWLSPYVSMKAVHNIDGDFTSGFTGGNHTLGDNIATMKNDSLSIYLDGIETAIESGVVYYCDEVDFKVVNLIQACNTCKTNGTGRAVVRETQFIHVNPDIVKYDNVMIEFLEDVTIESYYGMQEEIYSWAGDMWFVGDVQQTKPQSTSVGDVNGSSKTDCIGDGWFMVSSDGHEYTKAVLDKSYGIGSRYYLDNDTPTIISRSYGKFYTWLINEKAFEEGETLFYRCVYEFFNR